MSLLGSLFGWRDTSAKDPVCGMAVGPGKTKWSSEHDGESYYFCAKTCKEAFDGDPGYYMLKVRPRRS
jgi:YHS domain-containing protein